VLRKSPRLKKRDPSSEEKRVFERCILALAVLPHLQELLGTAATREATEEAHRVSEIGLYSLYLVAPSAEQVAAVTLWRKPLLDELRALGIPEERVRDALAKGVQFSELSRLKVRRAHPADSAFEVQLRNAFSEDGERPNAASKNEKVVAFLRCTQKQALRWVERALLRMRSVVERGSGAPRNIGAKIAAMRMIPWFLKTGAPRWGLQAALLLEAGLLETGCWQSQGPWCLRKGRKKKGRKQSACPNRRRLRCARATTALENIEIG
jgi:hypothetical protein